MISLRKAMALWTDPKLCSASSLSASVCPSFVLLVFLAIPAIGQSPEGSIVGAVKDPGGARVPNAHVTVRSLASGAGRETEANALGEYHFDLLPPGRYRIHHG